MDEELRRTIETTDEQVEAMSYRDRQKYYKNRSKICLMVWNTTKNGTLNKKEEEKKEAHAKALLGRK